MCQAKILMLRGGKEEIIMQDVIHLRIEGDKIWLERFFEDPTSLQAKLVEADFLKHTVTLSPLDEPEG
jgi:predicted RNA-binding protein